MSPRLHLTTFAVLVAALCACSDDPASVPSPSFSQEIAPIFASRCNICHLPGSAINVDLTSPFDPDRGIVNRGNTWVPNGSDESLIVDPGNVDNSFLIVKVRDLDLDDHVDGNAMPYHLPVLSSEELAAVETWIADGALNDAFFASEVAPIFGTEITLGRAAGRCTYCHYPDSSAGFSVLNVFDPVEGMVDADSSAGGKIVVPGDPANSVLMTRLRGDEGGPQMPLHYTRLGESEVQTLVDWIAAGAPDN